MDFLISKKDFPCLMCPDGHIHYLQVLQEHYLQVLQEGKDNKKKYAYFNFFGNVELGPVNCCWNRSDEAKCACDEDDAACYE